MTHEQAKKAMPSASRTVKVLEKLSEKKCDICTGYGKIAEPLGKNIANWPVTLCSSCNGIGKIKWKWEPKVAQWCIQKDGPNNYAPYLIVAMGSLVGDLFTIIYGGNVLFKEKKENYLPILEWEELQQILLKSDYYLSVEAQTNEAVCRITRWEADRRWDADKEEGGGGQTVVALEKGKNCQEVVMKAICELEEELK